MQRTTRQRITRQCNFGKSPVGLFRVLKRDMGSAAGGSFGIQVSEAIK